VENKGDKVSIIIPVYNSEQFLAESIESVLNQTYKNIEIIAVNDGSTDNSLGILEQYSDKITIVSQENKGLASALNLGISKMSGKWFKWFSPDDILFTNAIEILVSYSKVSPKNTIIYSNWEIIDEKGNKLRNFHETNYNDLDNFEFNVRLLDGQLININTTLIPSFLFDQGCIINDLNDPVVVDYDFFLRAGILYDTHFQLIEKNLLQYRIHYNQTSHFNITKSLKYAEEIKCDILSKLDETTQNQYHKSLEQFSKQKKLTKKTMELGLKIIKFLPSNISDQMLIFYLNKIRSGR